MKNRLPGKQTAAIWVTAALLAVLSLPTPPAAPSSGTGQSERLPVHPAAIPTMASVDAVTGSGVAGNNHVAKPHTTKPHSGAPHPGESTTPAADGTRGQTTSVPEQQRMEPETVALQAPQQRGTQPDAQQPETQQHNAQQPGTPRQGTQQAPGAGQPKPPAAQPPAGQPPTSVAPPGTGSPGASNGPYVVPKDVWPTQKLRIRVIDGRTLQPLPGAEVVLIETEQRVRTGSDGYTPWFDAPIIRNPRYRPMVQELHGQLGVIVYKNGYRDSVHLGIRMHSGASSQTTVWMYKLGPGDQRVEPVLYEVPYHHLWLVELADKFRSKTQPGEGPERP